MTAAIAQLPNLYGAHATATPLRRFNPVLFFLSLVAIVSTISCGFVSQAPNRLISGTAVALWTAAGGIHTACLGALGIGLLFAAFLAQTRILQRVVILAGIAVLFVTLDAAGTAAHALTAGAGPALRISLAAGFWIPVSCCALLIVDALQRLAAAPLMRALLVCAILAAIAAMAVAGTFSDLSIAREYQQRREVFANEFLRHVLLVLGAVASALLIGIPLGLRALMRPRFRSALFAVLNLIQTIPSIAIFGLLIAPLAKLAGALPALQTLGIQGVGVAPAVIALTAYGLLPVARSVVAGFSSVDPAAVEAANAIGFSPRQRRWQIEMPLAAPALLAGLRIVIAQTIGLTVVAALIGAGGLGAFVFQGIGQYANDLVLLGALPTIFLALFVDLAMYLAIAAARSIAKRPTTQGQP